MKRETIGIIAEYTHTVSEFRIYWLTISNAYLRVEKYDEVLTVLSQYNRGIDVEAV